MKILAAFAAFVLFFDFFIIISFCKLNFEFSAAYFEESKYDECIEWCQKAVDVGRETRADYKLISKAMARAGNAFQKKDDLNEAVNWYGKAVSEHRDPVIDSTNKITS